MVTLIPLFPFGFMFVGWLVLSLQTIKAQAWILTSNLASCRLSIATRTKKSPSTSLLPARPAFIRASSSLRPPAVSAASTEDDAIDFQADHGRGEDHLSALLMEGDVVVYQTGTWFVDGVEVGDGSPPHFEWARLDSLQVVWTHNCEHGVLRGIAMNVVGPIDPGTMPGNVLKLSCPLDPMEVIEFGPEQLVARVPVVWEDEEESHARTLVTIGNLQEQDKFWLKRDATDGMT